MAKFPKTPSFEGFMAPARYEVDINDLEVEGDIPAGIDGAFYRVNPDPQFPAKLGDDIWFNGDGMVSQFRFKQGRADFKHRWVHTDKFELEKKSGPRAVRRLSQSAERRSERQGQNPRHGQHQRHRAWRQAVGAQGGQPADRDGSEHARNARLLEFRRQDEERDLHRPSQARSRDGRHGGLRLRRQGPAHPRCRLLRDQRLGRDHA